MKSMARAKICLAAWVGAVTGVTGPSYAMQACPPRDEMREQAQIIVETRLKSLFIGDSGLLIDVPSASRMVRAELEIQRVIKGTFSRKDAVAIGFVQAPGPFQELSLMAMLHGAGDEADTFELEMSAQEIADGVKFYSLNDCIYYRFPALVEKNTGWNDNPGNSRPVAPLPAQ